MKKTPIKTSSAKNKGRRFQQDICKQISKLLNIPWGPDEQIASRPGSCNGTDVILTGEAEKKFKFACECKNQQRWAIHKWIEQARKNEQPGKRWLLFCKRNNMKPVVTMDVSTFFEILQNK